MPEAAEVVHVEVAYALPDKQRIVPVTVPAGTTALEAARLSGISDLFGGIELEQAKMGVFGKAVPNPANYVLNDGERIEIYRPLKADPKEARKQRAQKGKEKGKEKEKS